MSGRPKAEHRSTLALQFDVMTLAIFLILLGTLACSVAEIGPDRALDRMGCGLNDVINGLSSSLQPCR